MENKHEKIYGNEKCNHAYDLHHWLQHVLQGDSQFSCLD